MEVLLVNLQTNREQLLGMEVSFVNLRVDKVQLLQMEVPQVVAYFYYLLLFISYWLFNINLIKMAIPFSQCGHFNHLLKDHVLS
jgi:hypothetical protein